MLTPQQEQIIKDVTQKVQPTLVGVFGSYARGEATKKLSPDFRAKYPYIIWKKIAGMRDKLIHNYLGVICGLSGA